MDWQARWQVTERWESLKGRISDVMGLISWIILAPSLMRRCCIARLDSYHIVCDYVAKEKQNGVVGTLRWPLSEPSLPAVDVS